MWAMIVKEFRQVRRDHRTLAMMIVMPVVLLVVFGYAASFDTSEIPAIVGGPGAAAVADRLPDLFDVREVDAGVDRAAGIELLRGGEAVVVILADAGRPVALVDGSQLFSARAAVQAMTAAGNVSMEVLFNPELDTSVVLVPGLAGLILLFIGTVITSLGVVRERQAGTLEQLAVMPLRPRDVFVG